MAEDELISAYVDGRMSEPEQAVFTARLQADAALRRQVAVTRLLVDQSRQVEIMPAPKNFILPQDFGKAARPALPAKGFDLRLLFFRLGSVAAAMVFVFAVAFDAMRTAPAAMPVPAPAAAPMAAPMAEQAQETPAAEAAITTNIEPVTATLAPDQAPAAGAAAMQVASTPMMQARALQTDVQTDEMTETLPSAASAKSAPAPQTQIVETQNEGTPARIVALLALLIAIVLGIAGWRK